MPDAMRVTNLNVTYNDFALKDVSFSVPRGSITGFIGANGAGKTTTIKAILGLVNRDGGTVEVLGDKWDHNLSADEERALKERIGVVFDECSFHEGLRIKDVSKILRGVYRSWDDEGFARYLERFSLPADKKIKEFSRGMKMKLSVAAALSHNPDLLILDEATSGLDPIVREDILDIFLEFIQDENHSILISSHITSDLDKIADYVTFIDEGRIVFNKRKDEITDEMGIARCGVDDFTKLAACSDERILRHRKNQFGYDILINDRSAFSRDYPGIVVDRGSIEDIMLLHVKGDAK